MALTPQTNEAFLREVDDELRRDTALRFWKQWGRTLIVATVAALIVLAGYLCWANQREAAAGVEGEALTAALNDLSSGGSKGATAKLADLSSSRVPGYRAAAQLALADDKLARNDIKGATAAYAAIATDSHFAQPVRDLALVRQVTASFDQTPPAEVVARLRGLTVPGNPWFGSAGEVTAVALIRQNKVREAGAMLAAIIKDEGVPPSIRSRSIQLASSMGVETPPAFAPVGKGRN